MNIQDEIREAHKDYLQAEWDQWLITGWRKDNTMTAFSVRAFVKKHGISYEEFFNLKRTPRFSMQHRTRLSRFIAAYLPLLNTLLWSDRRSDDEILAAIKPTDTLLKPADDNKCKAESKERNKARSEAYAEMVSHSLVREQREYTARSNWKKCT